MGGTQENFITTHLNRTFVLCIENYLSKLALREEGVKAVLLEICEEIARRQVSQK